MGKTWRLRGKSLGIVNTLPVVKPLSYKPMALYSLFRRDAFNKKWIRVSDHAYSERLAYRIFLERIILAPLTYSIRPIKVESLQAQSKSQHHAQPSRGNFIVREPGKSEAWLKANPLKD
jgi:hypothetical protein